MAESDLQVKEFIVWKVLPVCSLLFGFYFFKKKIVQVTSAYIYNLLVPSMNKATKTQKSWLFSEMELQKRKLNRDLLVLEIGVGSGANFQFYPKYTSVTCLDPNPSFNGYVKQNSRKYDIRMNMFIKAFAEKMTELDDCTFDAVICTFVLCGVRNNTAVCDEIKRVLKPGGKFYFMEHVAAKKGTITHTFQQLLNPLWRKILGGCQIIKRPDEDITAAGFSHVEIRPFTGSFPFVFVVRPLCMGIVTK